MSDTSTERPGASAAESLRRLCRTAQSAVLGTIATDHKQVDDGWPVTSMVVPAIDIDGTPILLISDLADHTRHIKADGRVSLLFGPTSPTGGNTGMIETDTARLTLFGRAVRDRSDALRRRYLTAHPAAAQYADFADFGFFRIDVEAAYWVGGFGKQRRLTGKQFIVGDCRPLIAGHDAVIDHINHDHPDAIADLVGHHTDHDPAQGWKLVSIDCDGMILGDSAESVRYRLEFDRTVRSPDTAREILVEMCKKARGLKA